MHAEVDRIRWTKFKKEDKLLPNHPPPQKKLKTFKHFSLFNGWEYHTANCILNKECGVQELNSCFECIVYNFFNVKTFSFHDMTLNLPKPASKSNSCACIQRHHWCAVLVFMCSVKIFLFLIHWTANRFWTSRSLNSKN